MPYFVKRLTSACAALVPLLGLSILLLIPGCSKTGKPFPETERKPVTDWYYGTKITDNYRWLDDLGDPVVRKWNDAQNAYSRSYFDKVPALTAIQSRLAQLYSGRSVEYSSLVYCRKFFALKSQPPKNQRFIVVLDSPDDIQSEHVVVDPNELNPKGTTAIDWFVPSSDGRLLAVSLSDNGSEDGSVHIFRVSTGEKLPDVVPRVQYPTGGGSLEWNKDGSGFYYTRYPQGNERPTEDLNFYQQVYYHKIGTPASADTYVIGKDFPRIAEIRLSSSNDGRYLLATVANGDGGEFAHYLMGPDRTWMQLTQNSDKVISTAFAQDNRLYLLSRMNAPRGKIIAIPLANSKMTEAKTIVPQSDVVISDLLPANKHLYVVDVVGGPSQIRVLDLLGKTEKRVPLQAVSSVGEIVLMENDELLFSSQTYLDPTGWCRYDPATGAVTKTSISTASTVDPSMTEVVRESATSKDGTKIPMNIIRRKGTELDGNNPTILYGYGGFGMSQTPGFRIRRSIWLEQGGVYVIANLRGGGEYGEEWHNRGKLTEKQNVFDDFVACARYLIDVKYTNPAKLAIEGGSNGGLLMGAVMTQRPELFRAVVSSVGIYDMLRVELFPNGAFNVTEYGTVKDPEQFKALFAYSPYHHVQDGTAYPSVLFMTGDHDGRVDPANSRKMTARLQAATSSGLPVLLRTDAHAGHGIGTGLSTRVAQEADSFAFLFDQLGVEYKPVTKK